MDTKRIIRKCKLPECQNFLYLIPSKVERSQYCSKQHMADGYRRQEERICESCGDTFERAPSEMTNNRGKYCSTNCYQSARERKSNINRQCICQFCDKKFRVKIPWMVKKRQYCSRKCWAYARASLNGQFKVVGAEPTKIIWNDSLYWLLGIITTDGCLVQNRNDIVVVNTSSEIIENVQKLVCNAVTGRKYSITKHKKDGSTWLSICFQSKQLYSECILFGIKPNKSLDIPALLIPKHEFNSFLRGVIDGDGSVKTRKVNGKTYLRTRITSGSEEFLLWLLTTIRQQYDIKGGGFSRTSGGRSGGEINFSHYDSLKICTRVYRNSQEHHPEKYKVIAQYFDFKCF